MAIKRNPSAILIPAEAKRCLAAIGAVAPFPVPEGGHTGRPRTWLWPEPDWPVRLGISRQTAKNWLARDVEFPSPLMPWLRAVARHSHMLELPAYPRYSVYQRLAEIMTGRAMIILPPPSIRAMAETIYPGAPRRAISRFAAAMGLSASCVRNYSLGNRLPEPAIAMLMAVVHQLADDIKMGDRHDFMLIADVISHEISKLSSRGCRMRPSRRIASDFTCSP